MHLLANTGIHLVEAKVPAAELRGGNVDVDAVRRKFRRWSPPLGSASRSRYYVVRVPFVRETEDIVFQFLVDTLLGPPQMGCLAASTADLGSLGKELSLRVDLPSTSGVVERLHVTSCVVVPRDYHGEEEPVTIILDVGNSRTAIAVLDGGFSELDLQRDLALMRLGRFGEAGGEIIESWMELRRTDLPTLNDSQTTRSPDTPFPGPLHDPSLVRLGHGAYVVAADGPLRSELQSWNISMSSPKRYLWSQSPSRDNWFAIDLQRQAAKPVPLSGPLLPFVVEAQPCGTPALAAMPPVPNFPRSQMMVLFLFEALYLAFHRLNSVDFQEQKGSLRARFVNQVVATFPSNMPIEEVDVFRERLDAAVNALYALVLSHHGLPKPSVVEPYLDEGTASVMAFVHQRLTGGREQWESFVSQLLGGEARLEERETESRRGRGGGKQVLRIGCLDIGGGSIDATVVSYEVTRTPAGIDVESVLCYVDGISRGGDDVLEKIIQSILVPELSLGMGVARDDLLGLLVEGRIGGGGRGNLALARRLLLGLFYPAAIRYLNSLEGVEQVQEVDLGDLLGVSQNFLEEVEEILEEARPGLKAGIGEIVVPIDVDRGLKVFEDVLGGHLQVLSERLIEEGAHCIALAGRLSVVAKVADIVGTASGLSSARVFHIHKESRLKRFGRDAPRSREWAIDPKLAVVLGAAITEAARQELSVDGIKIRFGREEVSGRGYFWGRLDPVERSLPEDGLLFSPQSEGHRSELDGRGRIMIGRRLSSDPAAEAKPVYELRFPRGTGTTRVELERQDDVAEGSGLQDESLTIVRTGPEKQGGVAGEREGDGVDEGDDIRLRLKTVYQEEYWLDAGLRRQ